MCTKCGDELPHTAEFFNVDKTIKIGLMSHCKVCQKKYSSKYYQKNKRKFIESSKRYYQKNKKRHINNRLQRDYNITLDGYNKMLAEQDGRCWICGSHEDKFKIRLAVDHCHNTKKIRGLLCDNCNKGLGMLKDDPKLLKKAIKYLEKHNGTLHEIQKGAQKDKKETPIPRDYICERS